MRLRKIIIQNSLRAAGIACCDLAGQRRCHALRCDLLPPQTGYSRTFALGVDPALRLEHSPRNARQVELLILHAALMLQGDALFASLHATTITNNS